MIVLRKQTVDLNHFYWMSRHFLWLIPLTNLLIFVGLGLAFSFLVLCWPRLGSHFAARSLCGLTLLAIIWAAFPRIYGPAGFILAVGIAARLVPLLEQSAAGFRRFVRFSFPVLAIALRRFWRRRFSWQTTMKERAAGAGRCRRAGSPNVLLIVLDTVAADHLSLHGYTRPTSRSHRTARPTGNSFRPRAGDLVVDAAIPCEHVYRTMATRTLGRLAHSARRGLPDAGRVPGVSRL